MPDTVAELVGPSLERICVAASGRKFTQLRHEAKVHLQPCIGGNSVFSFSTNNVHRILSK